LWNKICNALSYTTEYECESIADAVETASVIALDYDEAELAQLLADRLRE
jgi:hypothetical protein